MRDEHRRGIPLECLGPLHNKSSSRMTFSQRWTRFNERHGGRFTFVQPPKHASWLNPVEIWFGILEGRILRNGRCASGDGLVERRTASPTLGTRTRPTPSDGPPEANQPAAGPVPCWRMAPRPHADPWHAGRCAIASTSGGSPTCACGSAAQRGPSSPAPTTTRGRMHASSGTSCPCGPSSWPVEAADARSHRSAEPWTSGSRSLPTASRGPSPPSTVEPGGDCRSAVLENGPSPHALPPPPFAA